jgi:hypothetical protein
MKKALLVLFLLGCGTNHDPGRGPASLGDGSEYPRDFQGQATLTRDDTGTLTAQMAYNPAESTDVLGCAESGGGDSFAFFLRHGSETLQIQITQKADFHEGKSNYEFLYVKWTGSIGGVSFDPTQQQYQLQSCAATSINRSGDQISGQFSCQDVVALNSNNQQSFELNFSCKIVQR